MIDSSGFDYWIMGIFLGRMALSGPCKSTPRCCKGLHCSIPICQTRTSMASRLGVGDPKTTFYYFQEQGAGIASPERCFFNVVLYRRNATFRPEQASVTSQIQEWRGMKSAAGTPGKVKCSNPEATAKFSFAYPVPRSRKLNWNDSCPADYHERSNAQRYSDGTIIISQRTY